MKRSRFLGWVLLSTGLGACAASPKKSAEPPPSEVEQRDGTKVTDSDREPGGAASTGAAATAQPAPLAAARGELERASADLEAGLSECTSACRALASMERAADHLCQLDGAQECTSARERVERARAKVKSSGCSCSK